MLRTGNLFSDLPTSDNGESFETLLDVPGTRIERIVSHSAASPVGFWYDQKEDEWVLVLKGTAKLRFKSGEMLIMQAGDYVFIPKRCRHRVEETSEVTIWLAVHSHPMQAKAPNIP